MEQVQRTSQRDPLLGPLVDAGTVAEVAHVAANETSMLTLLKQIATAGGAAGLDVNRWAGAPVPRDGRAPGLDVALDVAPLEAATARADEWHASLGAGSVACLLLGDAEDGTKPFVVLCGHRLPSMGALGECDWTDLCGTIVQLAGGEPSAGRFLLEEPPSALDADTDARLIERLRQLYGE